MIVDLGAYQRAEFIERDLGDQYTESGQRPRTMVLKLTTAIDEPFVSRTVTALLSEGAQEKLIKAMQKNLRKETA